MLSPLPFLLPTMKSLKNHTLLQLFIICTRYLIGGAYAFACVVKIQGERFTRMIPEGDSWNTPAHIFEVLYQSQVYWKFLGWGQFIAALLLMTQRYSRLGALVFLPISVNIFFITVSYGFTGTPIITGLMLLANIALIIWDWGYFKVLFNVHSNDVKRQKEWSTDVVWEILGFILFAFTISFRWMLDSFNIVTWGATCLSIGLIGLFIGLKRKSIYQSTLQTT